LISVKRKVNSIFVILAVIILCCSVWCVAGFAEDAGVIQYRWMPENGGDILGTETFSSFEEGWNAAMGKCKEGFMVEVTLLADWRGVNGKFAEADGIGFRNHTLYVAPGAKLTITLDDHTLDRGITNASVQKDFHGEVIYVDKDAEVTIRDGSITGGRGMGAVLLNNANVIIEGVKIYGNSVVDGKGAAIYAEGGSLEISYCEVYQNSAEGTGESYGAVYVKAAQKVKISRTTFKENKNLTYGSGVCLNGCEEAEITYCDFEKNQAAKSGGALWLNELPKLTVENCEFIECSANDGGAIYGNSLEGSIEYCKFEKNQAANNGGAVYMRSMEGLLGDCAFTENNAGKDGGAVYLDATGDADNAISLFGGNMLKNVAGGNGGGVYVKGDASTKYAFSVLSATINGNTAGADGGGIYLESYNTLTLWGGAEITSNKASGNGGGVCAKANTQTVMNEKAEVRYNQNAEGKANNFYLEMPNAITFKDFTSEDGTVGISHTGEKGVFAEVTGKFNRKAVFCDDDSWSIQKTNHIGGTVQLRLEPASDNILTIVVVVIALAAVATFVVPAIKKKKPAEKKAE